MAKLLFCALVLLGVATLACAPDPAWARFAPPWKRFLMTNDMAGGVDTSRIVTGDGGVEVWLRFAYAKPRSIGTPPIAYSVVEVRESVRCSAGLAQNEKLLIRDAQNDSVWGITIRSPRMQDFAGTGFGDDVFIPLCRSLSSR